jgi:regulatory protein
VLNKFKKLTPDQAKQKALRYCAYQERSHQEVKNKLYELGLHPTVVDELLAYLITEGFLSEERFAKSYAGGKFRVKKWGRTKIIHALEAKGITKNCIKIGLKEIDEADYRLALEELLKIKISNLEEKNVFIARDKASKFAIQRGYEPDLVWDTLKRFLPD